MRLGQNEVPAGVSTDTNSPAWLSGIVELGKAVASTVGQFRMQDLNMELIRQGRPPLSAAQMAAVAPQINVGVSPDTRNMMLVALGGIGLFFLATTFIKSRR